LFTTNIEKLLKFESIDKPGIEEAELILLKYANAEDVVKIVSEVLVLSSKGQPSGYRPLRPGEQASTISVEDSRTNVFADTRLNAVVLIADKQEKEAVKRMVALLDVPIPEATSKINVHFLEYADATELSKVLETMLSGVSGQVKAGNVSQPGQVQKSPFEPGSKIIISPDKATNALVIVASPADYQNLIQVIKQLDRKRRQVYVEAMIVRRQWQSSSNQSKWQIAERMTSRYLSAAFGTIDSSAVRILSPDLRASAENETFRCR
jgi:general secretion pathway protein D